MKQIARAFAVAMLTAVITPAFAADPIFPRGIRVGLVPAAGLAPATSFVGLESSDRGVKVLLAELPAAAFSEVEAAMKAGSGNAAAVKPEEMATASGKKAFYTVENGKDGETAVRRYSMIVAAGKFSGYVAVQVPEKDAKTYSDETVKQMFTTVALRQEVPIEEQLALMPFKMSVLGDFKAVRTLAPGAAIMLADGDEDTGIEAAPFMILGVIGGAPDQPGDRGRFAQQSAGIIPGLRDGKVTMSEPVRIDGAAGYETRIDATSGKDNTPVTVVQWLRFGSGGAALRIIASTPRDQWSNAFPRFRAVRDGIQSR
jgi:hypothetical protein